jgi:hypothetical protein
MHVIVIVAKQRCENPRANEFCLLHWHVAIYIGICPFLQFITYLPFFRQLV